MAIRRRPAPGPKYENQLHRPQPGLPVLLLIALPWFTLSVWAAGAAAATDAAPGAGALTVWTQTRVHENWSASVHAEPIWLAAFTAESEPGRVILGLVWRREDVGWFPVWKLQLYSETGALSGPAASASSGAVDLAVASPSRGREYGASLSFDPETGAYSALVTDLATGRRIAGRGGYVQVFGPERGPALDPDIEVGPAPRAGGAPPPPASPDQSPRPRIQPLVRNGAAYASDVAGVERAYIPVAAELRISASPPPGSASPALLEPGERLTASVDTQGSPAPGTFRFYVAGGVADGPGGGEHSEIAAVTAGTGEVARITVPEPYPAGLFTVEMEYADDGRTFLAQSVAVSHGQVEFRLAGVRADAATGLLSGELEVTSPFDLPPASLRVGGKLWALEWDGSASRYIERFAVPVPPFDVTIALSRGTSRIPFSLPVPPGTPPAGPDPNSLPAAPGLPFEAPEAARLLWRLNVEPELSFPIYAAVERNSATFALRPQACTLDVMSFNIRVPSSDGVNTWSNREPLVRSLFAEVAPAIAALQEPSVEQLYDLDRMLAGYRSVRVRPDARARVHNALYYRPDIVELAAWGTFWLSDTPETPQSSTWGNSEARALLWARFRLLATGQEFYVMNTHFHHIDPGEEIRTRSARLVAERVRAMAGGLPVLLMGDFNTTPGSPAYTLLVSGDNALFLDAWSIAAQRSGPEGTFHGFRGGAGGSRIDWLLVTPGVDVIRAEHVGMHDGALYPSDHYPVLVSVCLPG